MKFKDSQILIRIENDKKEQLKKIVLKNKTTISKLIHEHLDKIIKKEIKNV